MPAYRVEVDEDLAAAVAKLFAAHPEWSVRDGWRALAYHGVEFQRTIDEAPGEEEKAADKRKRKEERSKKFGHERQDAERIAALLPGLRQSATAMLAQTGGPPVRVKVELGGDHAHLAAWLSRAEERQAKGEPIGRLIVNLQRSADREAAMGYVQQLIHKELSQDRAKLAAGTHRYLIETNPDHPGSDDDLDDEIPF